MTHYFRKCACLPSPLGHVLLFATPRTVDLCPWTLQAGTLEWVAIPSSRGSFQPRDWTWITHVSCTGRQVLDLWDTWEAQFGKQPISKFFFYLAKRKTERENRYFTFLLRSADHFSIFLVIYFFLTFINSTITQVPTGMHTTDTKQKNHHLSQAMQLSASDDS